MNITPMKTTDTAILQLFSEHDDFMLNYLGDAKKYYTRYSEKEKLEKVWAVYEDGISAGCIAYRTKADGVGEVKRMFVRKEHRGKGFSKELLKTVEDYAKEQGCHTLFLDTRLTLEPAVSIYRAFGFGIVFQQDLYIQMKKKL